MNQGRRTISIIRTALMVVLWVFATNFCLVSPQCLAASVPPGERPSHDCCGDQQESDSNSSKQETCDDCGLCLQAVPDSQSLLSKVHVSVVLFPFTSLLSQLLLQNFNVAGGLANVISKATDTANIATKLGDLYHLVVPNAPPSISV